MYNAEDNNENDCLEDGAYDKGIDRSKDSNAQQSGRSPLHKRPAQIPQSADYSLVRSAANNFKVVESVKSCSSISSF